MATKSDFKAAQERIFARPRPTSASDQELLRKTEDDGVYPSPLNIKGIRLDRIVAGSRPPRTYCEESLADLGQSLLTHGQIMPILVQYQSEQDNFLLVDGERRWRAAQKVGLQTLHAIILGRLTPAERYEQQVAAALQQNDWDPGERVQALEAYKMLKGMATWAEVAEQLGISDATLHALLWGQAASDRPAQESEDASSALSQAAAAMRLLDHALSRVHPGQAGSADMMRLLADLAAWLAAQRARLQPPKTKARTEERDHAAEGEAKPVKHMPTWGQR